MNYVYLTNEIDEVLELINKSFFTNSNKDNFELGDNQKILLMKDNNILVGSVLITLKKDPIKNSKTYYLDYFCIKEDYRNKGYGKKLFEQVVNEAEKNNINFIELTSNKKREIARNMYLKFGMDIKDTDLFIKKIK